MLGITGNKLTGGNNTAVGDSALAAIQGAALDNTAVGAQALDSNTTGTWNTGVGYQAAPFITTGTGNTAVGTFTLSAPTALTGNNNTAVGYEALNVAQGAATSNTAVGAGALIAATTGNNNIAIGGNTLAAVTTGSNSTAVGYGALLVETTGVNSALGFNAGLYISTGTANTAIGTNAMLGVTGASELIGTANTAVGDSALKAVITTANANTAVGYQSGVAVTTGGANTALGFQALAADTTGANNTAVGGQALNLETGAASTAVGTGALSFATSGTNTALGAVAGQYISTGTSNTAIGTSAMLGVTGASELTGNYNTAVGDSSLAALITTAQKNTALGYQSGHAITSGTDNTLLGYTAGNVVTGNSNIIVGEAGNITTGGSNILIGNSLAGTTAGSSNQLDIGDIIRGDTSVKTVWLGGGALATTATDGFVEIATSAGVPTGVPTAHAGFTALDYDTTDSRLYTYNGGWLNVAAGATATLNGISAATGAQAGIANGNNTIVWNWATTSAGAQAMTFGESAASTSTGAPSIVQIKTLAASTATPLTITNAGASKIAENITAGGLAFGGTLVLNIPTAVDPTSWEDGSGVMPSIASGALNNTGVGYQALNAMTTASGNTAVGYRALYTDTVTGYNTALGALALKVTTDLQSTAVGFQALYSSTTGENTAVGYAAGNNISTGTTNTAIGMNAMLGIAGTPLTGNQNTALGSSALLAIKSSSGANTAIGEEALSSMTVANDNVAVGESALGNLTTGGQSTSVGYQSLLNITTATDTAFGYQAGDGILSGGSNVAIGYNSMSGSNATVDTLTGNNNVAIGDNTLYAAVTTAAGNTAVGTSAGNTITTGTNNVFAGYNAEALAATDTNEIVVGEAVTGLGSNTVNIGNVIKVTGTGTPSTSAVTIPGTLTVTSCTGCGGGAIGSTTQVAFNNAGTESGSADLTFTAGTKTLLVGSTSGAVLTVGASGASTSKINIGPTTGAAAPTALVPGIVSTIDATAQGANIVATTMITPGANTYYRATCYVVLSTAATTSSTLPNCDIKYTDVDSNTAVTKNIAATGTLLGATNTLGSSLQGSLMFEAKSGVAVQYDTGGTTAYATSGATSMKYAIHVRLEQMQ
jgi:hypothetical protein